MADDRKQLDLFLDVVPPHARHTDPETSHEAAARKALHLTTSLQAIMDAVRATRQRGMILDEIIDATGIQKVSVSPNLRPLARAGYLVNLPYGHPARRRMGKSGSKQLVWIATEYFDLAYFDAQSVAA